MGKSTKIVSLVLIFILLFSAATLTACKKNMVEVLDESYSDESSDDTYIDITDESSADDDISANLFFMPLSNDTYGVTAGNSRYLEEIVIPAKYNGKPVTAILENAFNGAQNLKKITVPDSITSVGDNAFTNCNSLEFNEYENALYIGNENNPYLILVKAKNITVTKCTVSDNAVAICDNAFKDCTDLNTLTIPNNVKSIGSYAFYKCSLLGSVNIPEGVSVIGMQTFHGCSKLSKIHIPASVKNIKDRAFSKCTALSEVTFSSNSELTGIANSAFNECKALKSITIPKNVTHIGDDKAQNNEGVFNGCSALETVNFEQGSKLETLGNYTFVGCEKLSSVSLPSSLTYLGHTSFTGTAITSISIPNGITNIGKETFWGCQNLKSVTFGSNLEKISEKAFGGCISLNNVTIPASVTTISKTAFDSDCLSLTFFVFEDTTNWYNLKESTPIDAASFEDVALIIDYISYSGIGKP